VARLATHTKKKPWWKNERLLFFLGIIILLIDQGIKFLFVFKQPEIDWGFVEFSLVRNSGASFGILQGQNMLLFWIGIMALGLFLFYFDRIEDSMKGLSIMVAVGVVSNSCDRILHSFVVDYINFGWFPVFNIADTLISGGVIALCALMLREEYLLRQQKK
jgi:signal peptidase II